MNALDEHCKVIIGVITAPLRLEAFRQSGFHGGCVVPSPGPVTEITLSPLVETFCSTHRVPYRHCGLSDLSPTADTPSFSLVTVTTAEELSLLHDTVLGSESQTPYYTLLCLLDLPHSETLSKPQSKNWLIPPPSWASELAECDGPYECVPFHLLSVAPVVRDSIDGESSTNRCTLSAVLKELAFKAGRFPKYGN